MNERSDLNLGCLVLIAVCLAVWAFVAIAVYELVSP